MILRKSFYIRWSAGRSPRVHEVNPGRDPSTHVFQISYMYYRTYTCLNELILVLWSIYLSYGSYPYAKVPVGTISRN